MASRRAGDGGEAGGSVETGRFSAPPLAGLLNDIDGVRLEGQTYIDLDDAPGAGDRTGAIESGFSFLARRYNKRVKSSRWDVSK